MKSYAELERAALEARAHAYAPYSGFLVGAALLARDGRVFAGANVENASYALSVCAERAAVIGAVLAGARALEAVAISTAHSPPPPPCGGPLQTRAAFAARLASRVMNQHRGVHPTT